MNTKNRVMFFCFAVPLFFVALSPAQQAQLEVVGSNVAVSVQSDDGFFYGLEESQDLSSWRKKQSFSGDGTKKTVTIPMSAPVGFFRFVREENGALFAPTNYSFSVPGLFTGTTEQTLAALQTGGISDLNTLLNRFRSVYRLNDELERLHDLGIEIESGSVLHLLREAELRANLQSAVDSGALSSDVLNRLVTARFSLNELYELVRLLEPGIGGMAYPMAEITPLDEGEEPLDRRSRESRIYLNNRLLEVGATPLTRSQFVALRDHISTLEPLNLAVITGTSQDRTEGRSGLEPLPAQSELNHLSPVPEDISYIPQAIKELNEARVKIQPVPLTIIGSRKEGIGYVAMEAQPPFTTDVEGTDFRTFLINRPGMAWFTVYSHAAGGNLHLYDEEEVALCVTNFPAQSSRAILMPIGDPQVCEEFLINTNGSADFTLKAIHPIESLDAFVSSNGLHAVGVELPTYRFGAKGGAGWYRFHVITGNEAPTTQTLHVYVDDPTESTVQRKLIAISPDGAVVEQELAGTGKTTMELSLINGLWQLMVVPSDAFSLTSDQSFPSQLIPCETEGAEIDEVITMDFKLAFAPVKTRSFVIGTLDRASFCHDGESFGNRAEIKLNLTANIAPYFQDSKSFNTIFGETQDFQAWDLWVQNGKSSEGLLDDEQFLSGLNAIMENHPEWMFTFDSTKPLPQQWLTHYTAYMYDQLGRDWYAHLDTAEEIYNAWLGNVVQINAMKFPMANRYNLFDSIVNFSGTNLLIKPLHPVVPVNMPQFAFPKDRMADESMPINCSFSAVEMDELDKSDLIGSFVKGVVNVGLSIANGNFADAACGAVAAVDEMNATIEAAKDDPIGTANYRMNRSSSMHGFYGLDDPSRNPIVFSGYAKQNQDYLLGNAISWAKLACKAYSIFSSSSFGSFDGITSGSLMDNAAAAQGLMTIMQGDLTDVDNLTDLFLTLAGEDPELNDVIIEFFSKVKAGTMEDDFAEQLDFEALSAALSNGDDTWNDFADLIAVVKDMKGVGQLGYNELHSNAYFPFAPYDQRKTQGRSTVSVVKSVPLRNLTVALDQVQVFDLQEEFGQYNPFAELLMNTRVGVVSDQQPTEWGVVELQYVDDGVLVADNGSKGYSTVGETPFSAYARRVFSQKFMRESDSGENLFPFGEDDPTNPMLINCQWTGESGNNAAAVFVEVGVFEDDGATCDDDMVGVFSQTFLLEDLMKEGQTSWTRLSETMWRLSISNAPVFASRWLETEVEIGTDAAEIQRKHNVNRLEHPSALISLHIDVTLGAFTEWVDENNYDVRGQTADEALSSEITPVVATRSETSNIDQILAYVEPLALTHQARGYGETLHHLDVWNVATNPVALTHQATLPGSWGEAELAPFDDEFYLNAALANTGRYVVVLSEQGLYAYDLQAPGYALSDFVSMTNLYPSRLAVDALGDLIYVSLRDYDKDLRVYQINSAGQLMLQAWYDDIPRTIVGLVPLPEGGLVVHYVAHTETDSHAYEGGYWDNPSEDIFAANEPFDLSNGFLHLKRNGGLLEVGAAIELTGDIRQSQMWPVDERHQSSMFRLYDAKTLISRGNTEFSLRLDSDGFFLNKNAVNLLQKDFYASRYTGVKAGNIQFSAYIPRRLHPDYARQYEDNDEMLSPACVYNESGFVPLASDTPVTLNCEMIPLANPRWVLTTLKEAGIKPRYSDHQRNRAIIDTYGNDGQCLALIDLVASKTVPLNPQQEGHILLNQTPISMAWIDNQALLTGVEQTYSQDYSACILDVTDPLSPTDTTWFCQGYYASRAVAAGASDGSSFVSGQQGSNYALYRFVGPVSNPTAQESTVAIDLYDLLWHPSGKLLGAGYSPDLQVYGLNGEGEWVKSTYAVSDGRVTDLALSEDGNILSVLRAKSMGMFGTYGVSLYDVSTLASNGAPVLRGIWTASTEIFGADPTVRRAVFSKDGQTLHLLISGYYGNALKHYLLHLNVSDPAQITIKGSWMFDVPPNDLCLSPDGTALIVAESGKLSFYSTDELTTSVPTVLHSLNLSASRLSLSPDGTRLAVVSGYSVHFVKL